MVNRGVWQNKVALPFVYSLSRKEKLDKRKHYTNPVSL